MEQFCWSAAASSVAKDLAVAPHFVKINRIVENQTVSGTQSTERLGRAVPPVYYGTLLRVVVGLLVGYMWRDECNARSVDVHHKEYGSLDVDEVV